MQLRGCLPRPPAAAYHDGRFPFLPQQANRAAELEGAAPGKVLLPPGGKLALLTEGGLTIKRNSARNLWGGLGDIFLILGRFTIGDTPMPLTHCTAALCHTAPLPLPYASQPLPYASRSIAVCTLHTQRTNRAPHCMLQVRARRSVATGPRPRKRRRRGSARRMRRVDGGSEQGLLLWRRGSERLGL